VFADGKRRSISEDSNRNADLGRVMETPLGRTVADDPAIPVIDLYVVDAEMHATWPYAQRRP
jgi:hypothetical protein